MKRFVFSLVIIAFVSSAFVHSDQFFKTQLKITVLDDLGNIQKDANVVLFTTEEDFKAEKNAIEPEEQGTDEKGVIWFKSLESKEYWVLASKDDKNNWGGGIKTDPLKAKKVNKINIIID